MLSLIKPSQNNPDNRQRKRLIKVCLPIFTLSYHYGNSGDADACLFAVCRAFADFSRG
jgi:hypothetical protein